MFLKLRRQNQVTGKSAWVSAPGLWVEPSFVWTKGIKNTKAQLNGHRFYQHVSAGCVVNNAHVTTLGLILGLNHSIGLKKTVFSWQQLLASSHKLVNWPILGLPYRENKPKCEIFGYLCWVKNFKATCKCFRFDPYKSKSLEQACYDSPCTSLYILIGQSLSNNALISGEIEAKLNSTNRASKSFLGKRCGCGAGRGFFFWHWRCQLSTYSSLSFCLC